MSGTGLWLVMSALGGLQASWASDPVVTEELREIKPGDAEGTEGLFVDYRQVRPKTIVYPMYPGAAKSLDLGDQRCRVAVAINAQGVPENVVTTECPEIFHGEVERAMLRSRWYPVELNGTATNVKFDFVITFRLGNEDLDGSPSDEVPPPPPPSSEPQVEFRDVQPKKLRRPRYPKEAKSLGLGDVTCDLIVSIDAKGKAEGVEVSSCPELFHPPCEKAIAKSRWRPYRIDGEAVPVRWKTSMDFRE